MGAFTRPLSLPPRIVAPDKLQQESGRDIRLALHEIAGSARIALCATFTPFWLFAFRLAIFCLCLFEPMARGIIAFGLCLGALCPFFALSSYCALRNSCSVSALCADFFAPSTSLRTGFYFFLASSVLILAVERETAPGAQDLLRLRTTGFHRCGLPGDAGVGANRPLFSSCTAR